MVAAALGYARYSAGVAVDPPDLVNYYLPAARAVVEGESPYGVPGYYYTPVVALMLALFVDQPWVVQAWVALHVLAGLAACLLGTFACVSRGHPLRRPAVLTLAVITLLYSWPTTFGLWLGQVDLLVLLALTWTVHAHVRGREGSSGFALGAAALVKTWPAALLLWLVRRPLEPRLREWVGVGVAALVAVALALAVGGVPALVAMARAPFEGSDQALAAHSVWGTGRLLFSESGPAEPLLVSPLLRVVTQVVLALAVVGLLVVTLVRPGNAVIALFNLAFVVILLLPLSHYTYLVLPLPALWWWVARVLEDPRRRAAWVSAVALTAWWVVALRRAPAGDGFASTTWESFVVIVASTLVAVTVSVVAAARLTPGASLAATAAPAESTRSPGPTTATSAKDWRR